MNMLLARNNWRPSPKEDGRARMPLLLPLPEKPMPSTAAKDRLLMNRINMHCRRLAEEMAGANRKRPAISEFAQAEIGKLKDILAKAAVRNGKLSKPRKPVVDSFIGEKFCSLYIRPLKTAIVFSAKDGGKFSVGKPKAKGSLPGMEMAKLNEAVLAMARQLASWK